MSDKIYIFYALISEEKNKQVKLHGPYIHHKPKETVEMVEDSFIFNKSSFKDEKKYLAQLLRQKHSIKVPIFHFVEVTEPTDHTQSCKCGYIANIKSESFGNVVVCPACKSNIDVLTASEIAEKYRQRAMFAAEDYFAKKFQHMKSNYDICNRKR